MMQHNSESERIRLVITGNGPPPAVISKLTALLPAAGFELRYATETPPPEQAASFHIDFSRQQPVADNSSITILVNQTSVVEGFRTILPALADDPPLLTVDLFQGHSHRLGASIALVADSFKQSVELAQRFIADTLISMIMEHQATAPGITGPRPVTRSSTGTGVFANLRGLLASSIKRVKRFIGWKLFEEQWAIAVAGRADGTAPWPLDQYDWQPLKLPRDHWSDYHADPFLLRRPLCAGDDTTDREWLLYEHYDHDSRKGDIRIVSLGNSAASEPRSLLSLSGHLSYPYVYHFENRTYMLPEQVATEKPPQGYAIDCHQQQPSLTGEPVEMPGLPPLYDATLFSYGDRYWLLGTLKRFSNSSHLSLWFAANPFEFWHPHRYMPIAINSQYGRPAGTPFNQAGRLIIPLQNSARGYGERIELFEVIELSPTEIDWRHTGTISKTQLHLPGTRVHGVHTLTVSNATLAVDYLTLQRRR